MNAKMFLHVDLDAFFASVEILDNPELKGKPLIVGGLPGERRSVVSTCSYEARKYGVHSAMPINKAYELCPQAIFLHGRMERYHEMSQQVMAVFREFSPDVMQMSIDEAFIDITGTELLFGDPVTLAKNLKKKVFDRTGLTVSVGIATNRYVAKIASGLKKPDGLCYVPCGEEEKFMLSLPLDKLWGIGTRSRERLNACGIFTIPEIHAISETALKELFGEASGSFLYRSVRGMDVEHFGDQAKSRSMSAEKTFCFDLSDIYSIETELLHLSYDVMLRVLKEKVNSKTVCLKIRYEDFTTVTVTESGTRIVSSIEDLFERSCRLFHKKHERGRGIRLLGLGLQNVADGLESSQGELFDFGEKKQRSVEKTVLKLHQKNPENRLKKARQLITTALAFFFLFGTVRPAYTEPATDAYPEQNIEFEVEGSWESILSTDSIMVIGGAAPTLSVKPPVFSQKADLLLWFMYDDHWYFDTSLSTDSDNNSIAAGYLGDGLIQEFRAGTDIGTDGMSPGVRLNLQGSNWTASARIHLDSVNTHTKTWKGSSELVSSTTPLSSYNRGFLFSIIDSSVAKDISGILVEDDKGTWSDSSGRHYKRLSHDEYLVIPIKGLVYLETPAKGAVIALTSNKALLETKLPAFLKDVSDWFGDRGPISSYTMMGLSVTDETNGPSISETTPLFTSVSDGSTVSDSIYLSKPGSFSPFQVASFYSQLSQDEGTVSVDSGNLYADYTASLLLEQNASLIQLHTSTAVDGDDFSKASVRFPAGKEYPWLYMPSSGITEDDVPLITETTPSLSDSFTIGSNAIESSIQVLKNGTAVPYSYDNTSGTVTLSSGYSENDTITIMWNEYSSQSDNMKLTVAADFNAEPTPYFKTEVSLSSLLSFDQDTRKLSSTPESEPSVSGSIAGNWSRTFGNFTLSAANTVSSKAIIASDSNEVPLFSLSGAGTEEIWFLDGAEKTESIPVLSSRSITQALPDLDDTTSEDFSISGVRKAGTSGLTLTLEGTLHKNEGIHPSWYAVDIPLSSGRDALPSAHEYSFTITDIGKQSADYDVYLQLGECTWLISSSEGVFSGLDVLHPFELNEGSAQTVKVMITDQNRMKLEGVSGMRLVFVNRSSTADAPIKVGLSGKKDALEGISFNVRATNASGSSIALPVSVTEDAQKNTCISWNTSSASPGDTIIVERCFPSVSASRYQKASFQVCIPSASPAASMKVNLLSLKEGTWTISDSFIITEAEIAAYKGSWYTVQKELTTNDEISKIQFVIDAKPSESGIAEIHANTVYLLDPLTSLTITDQASSSISWAKGDYAASLSADADAAVSSYPSLSGKLVNKGLTGSARASLSSPWLAVSGNGSFDMLKAELLSGEYLVSTKDRFLSGFLGFSDNYRWNGKANSSYRKDTISLSLTPLRVPFTVDGAVETDKAGNSVSENTAFSFSSVYKTGETSASLKVSQKNAPADTFSYLGNAEAQKRTESAVFTQKLSFANGAFTPALELGINASKEKKKQVNTGIFSQNLTIPFSIRSDRFSLSYLRETSAEYAGYTGQTSYSDDINAYFNAFKTHSDSLSVIPVYDLFQKDLSSKLSASLEKSAKTSRTTYAATSSASWNRPLRADWLDLVIPNAVTVTASRTLSLAGLGALDKKNASLAFTYTAFNCFGLSSSSAFFDWYDQDEFQYTVKLSKGTDALKTEITGYSTLYFIDDASLTTFYSGLISESRYSHTVQCSWNRPVLLFKKPASRITTGSFAIKKDSAVKNASSSGSVSHKANINITDIFSVSGSAAVSVDIREVITLNFSFSIGGKMQF